MSLWPFKSHQDLLAAGYYLIRCPNGEETTWCKKESCKAVIRWYCTPSGQKMPVDAKTYMTHFATCKGLVKTADALSTGIEREKQVKFDFEPEQRDPGQEG